jgi:hypothetical protein
MKEMTDQTHSLAMEIFFLKRKDLNLALLSLPIMVEMTLTTTLMSRAHISVNPLKMSSAATQKNKPQTPTSLEMATKGPLEQWTSPATT